VAARQLWVRMVLLKTVVIWGWFAKEDFVDAFANAAYAAKVTGLPSKSSGGQIMGYHIIEVTEAA